MQTLLHSRIELLESSQIRSFLAELCFGADYPTVHEPCCTVDNLLVLVLQLHNPNLTLNHFPFPNCPLTMRVHQLEGPIHLLAREIALNRGVQIGQFDGKAFLTFLKAAYSATRKPRSKRKHSMHLFR
jgi:hypothetical protein